MSLTIKEIFISDFNEQYKKFRGPELYDWND